MTNHSHDTVPGKRRIRTFLSRAIGLMLTLTVISAVSAQDRRAVVHSDAQFVENADDTFVGDLEPEGENATTFQLSSFDEESSFDSQVEQVGFLCNTKKSKASCDGCCNEPCEKCCPPWWAHRTGVFAQYLSLRPGSTDLTYAIEQDSALPNDDPTGPVGRVAFSEEDAYRVGFTFATSYCTSLVASYTEFSGSSSDFIQAGAGNVLYSTVVHPSEVNVGDISGTASASMGLDFQLFDLAIRHKYRSCKTYAINWLAGLRFGSMEQDFNSQQLMPTPVGESDVDTQVDFDGFGILLGLDAQRCWGRHGMLCYAKGTTSFLAGDWTGRYRQTSQFGGGVIGNNYSDYRVTPVVDLELGLAWQSPCGRCRANIGYMSSAWFDAVSTRDYIDAVHLANYNNVQEDITFSGLTTGLELRF